MASGLLMLIFSFLAWYKVEDFDSWSAWSNAFNLFPLATLVVLIGAVLAAGVAASRFGGTSLPDRVGGFTWPDLRLLFGVLATLTLLAYVLRSFGEDAGIDKGIGLIITLLAAIGFLVGAVLERQESTPSAVAEEAGGAGQPSPATLVLIGAGVLILIGSFLTAASSDGDSRSAWGEILFPLYTLPALLGVVIAAQVALAEFTQTRIPALLGVGWAKIRLAFAGWAALMMICLLVGRISVEGSEVSKGVGFWIMLIASIGLVVGAVMREGEAGRPAAPRRSAATSPPPPPPPA